MPVVVLGSEDECSQPSGETVSIQADITLTSKSSEDIQVGEDDIKSQNDLAENLGQERRDETKEEEGNRHGRLEVVRVVSDEFLNSQAEKEWYLHTMTSW